MSRLLHPGENELRVVVATTLKNKMVALGARRRPERRDLPRAACDPAVRAARPGAAGAVQPHTCSPDGLTPRAPAPLNRAQFLDTA